MIEKLGIWMKILKLGFEFVMVFLGDLKLAVQQNNLHSLSSTPQTPYIGLLP
ncbi:hypothetical protein HanIR_Chr16g0795351 [Helianthus annuus]|nr:hypothetical protein HanIR_Chr16g0795351 [Helianthus annuus]